MRARSRSLWFPTLLVTPLWLWTCGGDDDPAPASDSGSEARDTSTPSDGSPADGASGDTGTAGDTGSGAGDASSSADGGGACVQESSSCAAGETCCSGLMCCRGVPVPEGSEYCGVTCPRSDRDLKRDFEAVDVDDVLDGVTSMEITRWSYRDTPGVRHIGPMAQDFYGSFAVGETERNIAPIDAQGVALAAIQALARRQDTLSSDNARLRARIEVLERELARARPASAAIGHDRARPD